MHFIFLHWFLCIHKWFAIEKGSHLVSQVVMFWRIVFCKVTLVIYKVFSLKWYDQYIFLILYYKDTTHDHLNLQVSKPCFTWKLQVRVTSSTLNVIAKSTAVQGNILIGSGNEFFGSAKLSFLLRGSISYPGLSIRLTCW